MTFTKLLFATTAIGLMAAPAMAQKSKDTLRIALNNPFTTLSGYHVPLDDAGAFYREIYEGLVAYDEHKQKYVPMLAKSWKRISPTTLEFELRDDVKFHNGNTFDADDVVATINYIGDPKVRLVFKSRYTWVERVEKLGPHKIRIVAKKPRSTDLSLLAYRVVIWDGETLNALKTKSDYGRLSPVGTGIYKAIQVDKNKGTIIERNDAYNTNTQYNSAKIKRVHGIPIPERQTQVAQMLTGGIEVMRNVPPDTARNLKANPNIETTAMPSPSIFYLALDSTNQSGNKALSDPRVRLAVHKAINRDLLIKTLVPGGEVATKMGALCFKATTIGCKYSVNAPEYDPVGAKKFLAEAGYPNGFEMEYNVYTPVRWLGEAVAGQLRKVGITAKIQPVTIGVYRRKQRAGQLQAWSILFPTASQPDASNILAVYFRGPAFKYYNDPVLRAGMDAGETEFDVEARKNHYEKVFNRVNEKHYIFPVTSIPSVYAHAKHVIAERDELAAGDIWNANWAWK